MGEGVLEIPKAVTFISSCKWQMCCVPFALLVESALQLMITSSNCGLEL